MTNEGKVKMNVQEFDEYDDKSPCEDCSQAEYCDGWEARYCCTLCHWLGCEDCDDCNPMNI